MNKILSIFCILFLLSCQKSDIEKYETASDLELSKQENQIEGTKNIANNSIIPIKWAERENLCDPNSPEVTKSLKFLREWEWNIIDTPIWGFQEIKFGKSEVFHDTWEVCWEPVVRTWEHKKPDKIYYNNKIYEIENIFAWPKQDITDSISFYDHWSDKNDEVDENIFATKIINWEKWEIREETLDKNTWYPKTALYKNWEKMSWKYEYVWVQNGWDWSFWVVEWVPIFIVADSPAFSWEQGWPVPSYNLDIKYQVIKWDKSISKKYDFIWGLKIINDKIWFSVWNLSQNEEWEDFLKIHVNYDGKNYWTDLLHASPLIDTWKDMAYIWIDKNDVFKVYFWKNEVYTGEYLNYRQESFGERNFWDLVFIDWNMILNTTCEDWKKCIKYWDSNITEFSGTIQDISWKLIVYDSEMRAIFLQE